MKARGSITHRVSDKSDREQRQRLVVIGNGMVGFRFLERLTNGSNQTRYQITVFGSEAHPAYDRVNLTNYFRGQSGEQLELGNREWYREREIELRTGNPIELIDPVQKTVTSEAGETAEYDQLVIATGSSPYIPPILGSNLPQVHVYRTLEDVRAIREQAKHSHRAAVIGGGLLGLEAADALKELGLKTHIIERNVSLMSHQLPIPGAKILETQIRNRGFHIHLNQHTKAIHAKHQNLVVEFQNDEALLVDMVVIASGIRPNDRLAREAGLLVSSRGGIEVNDSLETSDPAISAIGECANHRGTVYGLVAPGYAMADKLAARLQGKRARFTGSHFATRLKLIGVSVTTLGGFNGQGQTIQFGSKDSYRSILVRNGKLVGATIVGDYKELNRLQEAIDSRRRIWEWQKVRFRTHGHLWAAQEERVVSQWPANAIVCNCLRINRATLSQHLDTQQDWTVDQLASVTGASSVCGSCRPLLANLVGSPLASLPTKGYPQLVVASLVSALTALAILFFPPISNSLSVLTPSVDFLWTDPFWKLVSGYSLTALCGLSLVLSLRKRIKRIQFGNFGYWRAIHATIGLASLLVLITHTGLRLGENLNFILMMNFLALAVVGGLAGFVTSLESRRSTPTIKRLRSLGTLLHTILFWPLPILIFFHAFKAYYY